uniref:Farnesyltransferase, CAAX box, subunit beta n=1 Tax=Laticauda laticaudata TaxID=8630 RepID=A0A8C5SAN4_LATLA
MAAEVEAAAPAASTHHGGAERRRHQCGGSGDAYRERLDDDGVRTLTSAEQTKVEDIVQEVFDVYKRNHHDTQYVLQQEKHFHYLKRGLRQLTDAYECLDASRPWLCYWILHSLELLGEPIPDSVASDVCQFLSHCQSPNGGFGGGPGQHPHLAPTYAAVNTLCIIGTEEAYNVINREKLLEYLFSLKQPDGSFIMHIGGEVDVRYVKNVPCFCCLLQTSFAFVFPWY